MDRRVARWTGELRRHRPGVAGWDLSCNVAGGPHTRLAAFTDALIPALVAGWALGRVLGPQFMVNGGGHETTSWFGMHYVGQVGKRVPVPLIQGGEDAVLWLLLLRLEAKWTHARRRVPSALWP